MAAAEFVNNKVAWIVDMSYCLFILSIEGVNLFIAL